MCRGGSVRAGERDDEEDEREDDDGSEVGEGGGIAPYGVPRGHGPARKGRSRGEQREWNGLACFRSHMLCAWRHPTDCRTSQIFFASINSTYAL